MQFHTVEQISPNQSLTPEGFLLCIGVPLARTGEMLYGPGETPVSTGSDGMCRIQRGEDEIFRDVTVASATGKPVVDEHPPVDVDPSNWRNYARGFVFNPRRGEGVDSDVLLADLMVTDAEAIAAVREGKREVSCGYDADYDETGPGQGRQRNIIFNHVALVDRGRCGPRCSIGDRATVLQKKERDMKTRDKKVTVYDRAMAALDMAKAAFRTGDEGAFSTSMGAAEKAVGELPADDGGEGGGKGVEIHNHMHMPGSSGESPTTPGAAGDDEVLGEEAGEAGEFSPAVEARFARLEGILAKMAAKMGLAAEEEAGEAQAEETEEAAAADPAKAQDDENKALEGNLQMEAPPGTADRAAKARDSAFLVDSFQETLALAEIIAPGIRVPTMDRKASPKTTFDTICKLRRTVLDLAYASPVTRGTMDDLLGGRPLDTAKMTCDAARTLFRAVGKARKDANNAAGSARTQDVSGTGGGLGIPASRKIHTLADLNRINAARYSA